MSESLTDEDIERIAGRLATGGASISIRDPRVNNIQSWVFGILGTLTCAALLWGAASISKLNENMARVISQNESIVETLKDHSDRLKDLERRNVSH